MGWHTGKPILDDTVEEMTTYVRENFAVLEPLTPYMPEILGGRVAEHNLDTTSPATGYYVRWACGLQLCFIDYTFAPDVEAEGTWVYPAAFTGNPVVLGTTSIPESGSWMPASVLVNRDATVAFFYAYQEGGTSSSKAGMTVSLIAIGRWTA